VQNCAALTDSLLDDELFGHVRGAFTGATSDRPGLFEAADGGTVFLDEVGEMSLAMQAKLLRVLQNGEVRRVGSNKTSSVDVRVVCATHRDLEEMVRAKGFREDLYYRLRNFQVHLPPLRERRDDVAALCWHFFERFVEKHQHRAQGFTPPALRLLAGAPWRGNVRELEHTVERLVVLTPEGTSIDDDAVRRRMGIASDALHLPLSGSLEQALLDFERRLVVQALETAGGVVAEAARSLGAERSTLSKRMKRLGLRG
jgi:transcriptional regulator with GAF, ATPase, and Fis domain